MLLSGDWCFPKILTKPAAITKLQAVAYIMILVIRWTVREI